VDSRPYGNPVPHKRWLTVYTNTTNGVSLAAVCACICVSVLLVSWDFVSFRFVSGRSFSFRLYKGTFPHGHMYVRVCEWYAAKAATKQTEPKRLKRSLWKAKLNSSCCCCCWCFAGDVGVVSSRLPLHTPHHPPFLLKHFCLFQRCARICISDVGWLVRSAHWQSYLYLPGTFCPLRVRSVLFYALLPRLLCNFALKHFFVFSLLFAELISFGPKKSLKNTNKLQQHIVYWLNG